MLPVRFPCTGVGHAQRVEGCIRSLCAGFCVYLTQCSHTPYRRESIRVYGIHQGYSTGPPCVHGNAGQVKLCLDRRIVPPRAGDFQHGSLGGRRQSRNVYDFRRVTCGNGDLPPSLCRVCAMYRSESALAAVLFECFRLLIVRIACGQVSLLCELILTPPPTQTFHSVMLSRMMFVCCGCQGTATGHRPLLTWPYRSVYE